MTEWLLTYSTAELAGKDVHVLLLGVKWQLYSVPLHSTRQYYHA
jgi:hypothetical protein